MAMSRASGTRMGGARVVCFALLALLAGTVACATVGRPEGAVPQTRRGLLLAGVEIGGFITPNGIPVSPRPTRRASFPLPLSPPSLRFVR